MAGPVFAAAVVFREGHPILGVADSKVLSPGRREALALTIKEQSLAWAIAQASVEEIDSLNILQASLLAMRRAVLALGVVPSLVLVDGRQPPRLDYPTQTVVKGDATIPQISAASILAKTARDLEMLHLHEVYPQYGLDRHKGYPTADHLDSINRFGICACHRKSFAPVRRAIEIFAGKEP